MTGWSSHVTPPAILSVDLGMPLSEQKLTHGEFANVKLFNSDLVAEDTAGHHVPQRLNHWVLIGPGPCQCVGFHWRGGAECSQLSRLFQSD